MAGTEVISIGYTPEAENTDGRYADVFDEISKDGYMFHETESVSDFLKRRIKPVGNSDYKISVTPDNYFLEIAGCFGSPKKDATDTLENLIYYDMCRVNKDDSLLVSPKHPIVTTMDDYFEYLEKDYKAHVKNDRTKRNRLYHMIASHVLRDFVRNKEFFLVYGRNQTYYCGRSTQNDCRRAIPWDKAGSLTEIDAIRLIEKITSWLYRRDIFQKIQAETTKTIRCDVRIAYFGTLTHEDHLIEYFKRNTFQVGDKSVKCNIQLIEFCRKEGSGEYYFEVKPDNIHRNRRDIKKVYNLMYTPDLRELFAKFDIIFFLDESWFYKQRQFDRGEEEGEEEEEAVIRWQGQELSRAVNKKKVEWSPGKSIASKMILGLNIYEKAGLWLNSLGDTQTGTMSFDNKLFNALYANKSPYCNVYLYISKGNQINELDLSKDSRCSTERFDGRKLLVYMLPVKSAETDTDDTTGIDEVARSFIDNNSGLAAYIEVWDLVKGIGRSFCEEFLKQWDTEEDGLNKIKILKSTYISLYCRKDETGKITSTLLYKNNIGNIGFLKDFVTAIIEICNGDMYYGYVEEFITGLFVESIISGAASLEGLLCAYLMTQGNILLDAEVGVEQISDEQFISRDDDHLRACNSVYTAIEGMDTTVVRKKDEYMHDIFAQEFRYSYCKELSEKTFKAMLSSLHGLCEQHAYTGSRLYLMTG